MSNRARALMFQGTGSNVGKSMLVAGLCRAARKRGLSVAPFKPQNMSNNAAVTIDGGEIGRAQALQAQASGLELHTDMNPVLLKPETDIGAQVIVQGKRVATTKAREYAKLKPTLMRAVLESFERLRGQHDLVIVEGAGSPAEINLRAGDIANMGFAEAAKVPVVLVGDIDRGGVIAQLVGTSAVLDKHDAERISGFLVNKFRGDPSLFDDGYASIQSLTGWPGFGVLPWFHDAHRLPAEDALDLPSGNTTGEIKVVCLALPRIANFDDIDPLAAEPDVAFKMLTRGEAIPGDTSLVIVPGSKSTRSDLEFMREQGWDIDILAHVRRGGRVLGICGGYQVLGKEISDPDGIEGPTGTSAGLGLLDVSTTLAADKTLTRVTARHSTSGSVVSGYEIHMGQTHGPDCRRPFAEVLISAENDKAAYPDGAVSADGCVTGTYLHGLFTQDAFRQAWLQGLGAPPSNYRHAASVESTLDALAKHVESSLDVEGLFDLAH